MIYKLRLCWVFDICFGLGNAPLVVTRDLTTKSKNLKPLRMFGKTVWLWVLRARHHWMEVISIIGDCFPFIAMRKTLVMGTLIPEQLQ